MSKVYFCSDFHLGHKGISRKFRPEFATDEDHDQYMMDAWNTVVKKRDTVYCLGDMALSKEGLAKISTLQGTKHLIVGNHDVYKNEVTMKDLVEVYDRVSGDKGYKGLWLSHCPVHPNEVRSHRELNVHGHVHRATIDNSKYLNICPENNMWGSPMWSMDLIEMHEWLVSWYRDALA